MPRGYENLLLFLLLLLLLLLSSLLSPIFRSRFLKRGGKRGSTDSRPTLSFFLLSENQLSSLSLSLVHLRALVSRYPFVSSSSRAGVRQRSIFVRSRAHIRARLINPIDRYLGSRHVMSRALLVEMRTKKKKGKKKRITARIPLK